MMIFPISASHDISPNELNVLKEIHRNWKKPELKIANILLEGDAGSGKTELAKSVSFYTGLPYTKVTCFADMDKTDIFGSILPVMGESSLSSFSEQDQQLLKAIYGTDDKENVCEVLEQALGLPSHTEMYYNPEESWEHMTGETKESVDVVDCLNYANNYATSEWKRLVELSKVKASEGGAEYRFFPSEIVRAFKYGYLLEIQEPTVIRDAAVLMGLNSALEPDGSLNLPTEVVQRHPDFVAIVTTNRNYQGCRPLNEALRDRMQHVEKWIFPERGNDCKSNCKNRLHGHTFGK